MTADEVIEPLVSVVLVNFRGADDTIACLRAFDGVDWPADRLELVVVDNDSGDGSEERIRAAVPHAVVHQSGGNLGFAGGCNLGVSLATGEFVGFINNDARPDPRWVRAAVEAFQADPKVGAVASKVLDWDGTKVDYVDASLTWYGMGYKREAELPDSPLYDRPRNVMFGTGAAMFVPRDLYQQVGGFDERFFMFYEDVDLGWRLNLLGYHVRYVPTSLAFHRHHVTMKKFGSYRELYLLERNALMCVFKNLSDDLLRAALGPAMILAMSRSAARSPLPEPESTPNDEVPKLALTGAYAFDYLRTQLPTLVESRREIQATRQRSDAELLPLFRDPIEPAYPMAPYLACHEALVEIFDLEKVFHGRSRILVVTGDPLSDRLAGPGIRAWQMASAVAATHPVRLCSTTSVDLTDERFDIVDGSDPATLDFHLAWAQVVIFQGFLLEAAPWLVDSDKIIVADIYDPIHLELMEQAKDRGPTRRREQIEEVVAALNAQIVRADLLLCASEKQRSFWTGQLASQGRINAATATAGNELLRVVPFGLDDVAPAPTRHGIRGVIPGVGMSDKVILWGGGVYNWFDPLTLVRAVAQLSQSHADVRLVFMGMKHPHPGVPTMRMAWQVQQLADELGLTDRFVFFNRDWVPYRERDSFLMDADVGVSTHFEHVETAFSFRTRILDYLWAGLPIVATVGDSFGNVITSEGLGRGVPPEDVDALAAALEDVLYTPGLAESMRARVTTYAEQYRWSRVLQPLTEFCDDPAPAPDRALQMEPGTEPVRRPDKPSILELVRFTYAKGGIRLVAKHALFRLNRFRAAKS